MLNQLMTISGDGGGSPPKPHNPVEADDTLSSKQRLRMLFVVGEGKIKSINDVFVNGTPIDRFDATWEYRDGTVDQSVISGFSQVEAPNIPSVNAELLYGLPIAREVSSNNVDAVRVTLKINGLSKITAIGDKVGHSVNLRISTRKDASDVWTVQKLITKTGKASSIYKMDIRIERPANAAGSTWQIQAERTSSDDADSKSISPTFFDNFTEIQDVALNYPHSALLGVVFNNAVELGGELPEISCEGEWREVKVPNAAAYDAVNREYTGSSWSGGWALSKVSTDCLAWVAFDVLTDARAGLGISEAEINKFSFFDFAKECDELIDDGKGLGTLEPRFSVNNQFFRRENAATFLTFLFALGNFKLYTDEFGLIAITSDAPADATKIVNNSNVIDGVFDYKGNELDDTFSKVNVTFNDPEDKYNTTTITETRQDRLDRYGVIPSDLVLVGCTSEGQARRKAKWMLNGPDGIINFKTGQEGFIYRMGQIITVMDNKRKNVEQQGRVSSASSDASFTTIVLDREFVLSNQSYSIICYGEDAETVYEAPIVETNVTTNTITVNVPGPLPSNPNPNSPFIIVGDIAPSLFKVVSIALADNDDFTVTGTTYDPDKRALIEGGIVNRNPQTPFINTEGFLVEPVENIVFNEIFAASTAANISRISVTWDWDIDSSSELSAAFQYTWRRDGLPFKALETTTLKEFEIDSVVPGVYEVVITAFNPRGISSVPVIALYNFRTTEAQSTLKPPTDLFVINTVGTTFQTRDLSISWFYDLDNDDRTLVNDSLLDYVIEIWSAGVLKNSYTEAPNADKNGLFTYTFQDNENDHGTASRSIEVRVYSRDTVGDVSLSITNTFTNPVPPVVSFSLLAGTGAAYVDITPSSDPDTAGYLVYRDTSSISFTPSALNLKYDGPDNYIALGGDSGVEYFYKVAAYDSFGKSSPNLSGGQSSTTLAAETDKFAFTGLQFTPNLPSVNSVAWAAGTVSMNGASPVAISAGNAAWTSGTLYIYFDKDTVAFGSTTDITIAVQKSQIIAAYEGGLNLNGGDGTAFFNGAQLLAQSIGASQLVTDTAIITQAAQMASAIINNAHIEDLAVDDAKIANTLESTNYDQALGLGYKLDKLGGQMTINDLIFKSRSSAAVEHMAINNEVIEIFDNAGNTRIKLGKLA